MNFEQPKPDSKKYSDLINEIQKGTIKMPVKRLVLRKSNGTQTITLPDEVRFPDGVKEVMVRVMTGYCHRLSALGTRFFCRKSTERMIL